MFCTECQNPVRDCTCGDIEERLERISEQSEVVTKWCVNCDSHYARCECGEPEYVVR